MKKRSNFTCRKVIVIWSKARLLSFFAHMFCDWNVTFRNNVPWSLGSILLSRQYKLHCPQLFVLNQAVTFQLFWSGGHAIKQAISCHNNSQLSWNVIHVFRNLPGFPSSKTALKKKSKCEWQQCWLFKESHNSPSLSQNTSSSFPLKSHTSNASHPSHICIPASLWKVGFCRFIISSDLTPMSLCQVNTHRAVVGGSKPFHRSAFQTNSYCCSLKQPPLVWGTVWRSS